MMDKKFLFTKSAISFLIDTLRTEGKFFSNPNYINDCRYAILPGRKGTENIAITFKKEWFLKFGDMGFFNEELGKYESGLGDTINVDDLKLFKQHDVKDIYIIFKDGRIYKIGLDDFLINSYRWTVKEGKDVRSISIHKLERINCLCA